MAQLFRHHRTKGVETDTLSLTSTAPHSYSTVNHCAGKAGCHRLYLWFSRLRKSFLRKAPGGVPSMIDSLEVKVLYPA